MTPCPASGPISIAQIMAAFPSYAGVNSLANLNGVKWYKTNNSRGFFVIGNTHPISLSAFYDTREASPAIPGSVPTYTTPGTYSFTVPMFNKLTITCVGGGGGSAGGNGLYFNGPNNAQIYQYGFPGGNGNTSSFGSYLSASGGTAGNAFAGPGPGATTTTVLDVDQNAAYLNLYGTQISVVVGSGGVEGAGGMNALWTTSGFDRYEEWYRSGSGSVGAAGSVSISWT